MMRRSLALSVLALALLLAAPATPARALFDKRPAPAFVDLPSPVQQTILRAAAWGVVTKTEKKTQKGAGVYIAEVSGDSGRKAILTLTGEGKLLLFKYKDIKWRYLKWDAVPAPVRKTFQAWSDRAKPDEATLEIRGGFETYIAKVELPRMHHLTLRIAADGRLLELKGGYDYSRAMLTRLSRDF